MARATYELVHALRRTAGRLANGSKYKWSHFANCNCGNLAQTITQLDPRDIYEAAFDRPGDWGEQAIEYCPSSGYPMDWILGRMLDIGLDQDDIGHLERLSDDRVRRRVGRPLHHTRREDVVDYMRAWADLLEADLPDEQLPPSELLEAAE